MSNSSLTQVLNQVLDRLDQHSSLYVLRKLFDDTSNDQMQMKILKKFIQINQFKEFSDNLR